MANREERENQAKRHVAVMKAAFAAETAASIAGTRLIEAGYAPALAALDENAAEQATTVSIAPGNLVSALFRAEKPVAVLDAASYRYAGGGYLRGWAGPEEDLCAEGNLYPILQAFEDRYYQPNAHSASGELYTSRALAIPDVLFSRNGDTVRCAVAVVAPPNRSRALQRNRSERECDLALAERIDAALRVLASFNARTVIIPAFGCGANGNSAAQVAQLIHDWVSEHDGLIPHIEFAVWRGDEADAFKAAFASRLQAEEPQPSPVAASEEEGEDGEESDWEQYRILE